MAESNIVAGLFGLTPQMYGEQQRRSALREGVELAQLDPASRGAAMTYAGARGLGGAIAGAMGVEDPQLKMISARQQIMSQLDQSDPNSLLSGAKILAQAGDQQGAMALAQYARQAQSEMAQAQQRLAAARASDASAGRERQQATPNDIQIANRIASLKDGITQLEAAEQTPENNRTKNLLTYQLVELERMTNKDKPDAKTSYGAEADRASKARFGKNFSELTQEEAKVIDDLLEERGVTKAKESASKVLVPGQPVAPKDWMDFTQKVLSGDPVMQRTSTILSDAPSAIEIIRNSTSNDFAAASLPTSIALLTGQGKNMSNADVNRFARTGGLDDRLAQDAVKFFTGGTTQVKKDQAEKFAVALYRGALLERKKKLESAAQEFGYTESPNYKFALKNIDDQLAQFKLVKKGESAPTATSSDDDLINKYSNRAEKK
tara:strand:+ start:413 stop:1717 length:1305 start_codon:yes stop_codon:yes gene_type:complete